jgi:hypothetical protein
MAERCSSDDEVPFPVPGHGPVLGFGGPLAQHVVGADVTLRAVAGAFSGFAQGSPGAKARHQLTLERAPALDVERLVDRLVADTHVLIMGEVNDQPS